MGMEEVISIVLDALPNTGGNPDYPELMRLTLTFAARKFGTCSSQFRTILRAWEQICVNTKHPMRNPDMPCLQLVGSTQVCEENENIYISLSTSFPGFNLDHGRWRLLGRRSSDFQTFIGMQGNTQYGGYTFVSTHTPKMPYYPQTMTLSYWHPLRPDVPEIKIQLIDCLGDDPDCHQYYTTTTRPVDHSLIIQENQRNQLGMDINGENKILHSDQLTLVVYNMQGVQVPIPDKTSIYGLASILIYTYWDREGNLMKTQKVFISE